MTNSEACQAYCAVAKIPYVTDGNATPEYPYGYKASLCWNDMERSTVDTATPFWREMLEANGIVVSSTEAVEMSPLERELREMVDGILDGPDPVECIYCGRDVSHDSETIPSVDDDEAWAEYAKDHAADCEWILTRAHRLTGQHA